MDIPFSYNRIGHFQGQSEVELISMLTKKGEGEPEKLLNAEKDKKLSMVVRLKKPTDIQGPDEADELNVDSDFGMKETSGNQTPKLLEVDVSKQMGLPNSATPPRVRRPPSTESTPTTSTSETFLKVDDDNKRRRPGKPLYKVKVGFS